VTATGRAALARARRVVRRTEDDLLADLGDDREVLRGLLVRALDGRLGTQAARRAPASDPQSRASASRSAATSALVGVDVLHVAARQPHEPGSSAGARDVRPR
jgi:hypothetical protein